jgi:lysozyme
VNRDLLVDELKRDEGLRLTAYRDTLGVLTVGYGHTGHDVTEGLTITEDRAEELLRADIETAWTTAHTLDFFAKLNPVRQRALVNMTYQLGVYGVMQFRKACDAMRRAEWYSAAVEMCDSRWHDQTPQRCERAACMVLTGIDPQPTTHAAVARILGGVLDEVHRRRQAA